MNQQPPPSNPPQEKKLETSPTSKVSTEITAPNSKWEKVRFVFPQPNVLFGKGVVEYLPDAIYELLTPTIYIVLWYVYGMFLMNNKKCIFYLPNNF